VRVRAFPKNRSRVGMVNPEEKIHERGFAGPVLAQDGMDLARLDVEIDAVERGERAESLREAASLE